MKINKIHHKGLVYYYDNEVLMKEAKSNATSFDALLRMAEIVVDKKNNEIVKMRFPLEYVIDKFYVNV